MPAQKTRVLDEYLTTLVPPTVADAINHLVDDAIFMVKTTADGVATISEWENDDVVQPSDAAISAELARLTTLWENFQYGRDRKLDYPDWEAQMADIYDDMKDGTTKHKDAVEVVKARYPKP